MFASWAWGRPSLLLSVCGVQRIPYCFCLFSSVTEFHSWNVILVFLGTRRMVKFFLSSWQGAPSWVLSRWLLPSPSSAAPLPFHVSPSVHIICLSPVLIHTKWWAPASWHNGPQRKALSCWRKCLSLDLLWKLPFRGGQLVWWLRLPYLPLECLGLIHGSGS